LSLTSLDRRVDSEETTKCAQGAQKEAITVAVRLTGLILNKVAGYTRTF
jgi:hypothetical protein